MTSDSKTSAARAALFAALGQLADREGDRSQLAGGRQHEVSLAIKGAVDDQPLFTICRGQLAIGVDATRVSSSACSSAELVAHLLTFIPKTRRAAALTQLVEAYRLAGGKLPVEEELKAAAETALKKLRQEKTITVRGSVRYDYELTA